MRNNKTAVKTAANTQTMWDQAKAKSTAFAQHNATRTIVKGAGITLGVGVAVGVAQTVAAKTYALLS